MTYATLSASHSKLNVDLDLDIEDVLEEISDEDLEDELRRRRKGGSKNKAGGKMYSIKAMTLTDVEIMDHIERLIESGTADKMKLLSLIETII
jgi:hypothetical protein